MTHNTRSESYIHPAAEMYATELKSGQLDRREFLSRTTALGLSASAAYALGGLATPALAGGHMQVGGTIRFQMEVRALKDPRLMTGHKSRHILRVGLSISLNTTMMVALIQCFLKAGAPTLTQHSTR